MTDANDPRLIAFYLPQFHPIPENDLWWGRGFTEWTNLTRSQPLFPGHVQPRLPADLGFYDLRLPDVREVQADLARRAGVSAFCYYHYWFGGRRLLERPFNEVVNSGRPDFPFCVCWANESWTRRWDGLEREVLMAQDYAGVAPESFIRDLLPALRDPRYVRVDGKALLLVYRPESVPEMRRWTDAWRAFARANGVGELLLCRVHSFSQEAPEALGFDAAVEFPPLGGLLERSLLAPAEVAALIGTGTGFQGMVADYPRFARMAAEAPPPPFRRFRGVAPSWDNTPRRRNRALVFTGANPDDYEQWLAAALERTVEEQPPGERLVFVNAWNEWAEGCHLEPDAVWGDRYLCATRAAIASARHRRAQAAGGADASGLVELLATRERSIRALSAEVRARDGTILDLRRRLAAADLAARSAAAPAATDRVRSDRNRKTPASLAGGRRPTAIIFGAGKGGERVLRVLRDSWEVLAIVDNDTGRHGSEIDGVRVAPPNFVQENEGAVVFLASMHADEIQAQLLSMGVARARIRRVDTQILIGAAAPAPDASRRLEVIIFGTGEGGAAPSNDCRSSAAWWRLPTTTRPGSARVSAVNPSSRPRRSRPGASTT